MFSTTEFVIERFYFILFQMLSTSWFFFFFMKLDCNKKDSLDVLLFKHFFCAIYGLFNP